MKQRRPGRPKNTSQDTSAALAKSALHRFATQGFEVTTLREIAADAGVDISLISYNFGGKSGLWRSIVSDAGAGLQETLAQAERKASTKDPFAALEHAMRAFVDYLMERPEIPSLLLRDITIDTERSEWLLNELSMPLHQHFFSLARDAAGSDGAKSDHAEFRMANFIYSAASTVARRQRLAKLIGGLDDDAQFKAALVATLIEPVFSDV